MTKNHQHLVVQCIQRVRWSELSDIFQAMSVAFCYVSLNAELRKIWWRKTVKKGMGYTSKHRAKYSALMELFLGVDDIQSNDYVF